MWPSLEISGTFPGMRWFLAVTVSWLLAGCANPDPNHIQVNQDFRQWQDSQAPAGWY